MNHCMMKYLGLFLSMILYYPVHAAQVVWSVSPNQYSSIKLVQSNSEVFIRQSQSMNKLITLGMVGEVSFVVNLNESGWYQLVVQGAVNIIDTYVDENSPDNFREYVFHGVNLAQGKEQKVANLWLKAGQHQITFKRYVWNGFPPIQRIKLIRSDGTLATIVQILDPERRIAEKEHCQPYRLLYGELADAKRLEWQVINKANKTVVDSGSIDIDAVERLSEKILSFPCSIAGNFQVIFLENGREISKNELPRLEYDVIDTQSVPISLDKGPLVLAIDVRKQLPDYYSGTIPILSEDKTGMILESGDDGWVPFVRTDSSQLSQIKPPSWFAYRLENLTIQKPYWIEVVFPDNADRTFIVALQERKQLPYPVSYGVDSGGPYRVSGQARSINLFFWPRTSDPRLVFLNAFNGKRIAVSAIRVYELVEKTVSGDASKIVANLGKRRFVNWYEEGGNFAGIYGAMDNTLDEKLKAIDRWFQIAHTNHVNMMVPTVSVYSDTLFPSDVDRAFSSKGDYDVLAYVLLIAKKQGMDVVPELHPRADPLVWPYLRLNHTYPNTLVSKNGESYIQDGSKNEKNPRYFNPIFPENQQWYLSLIGEVTDRYKYYDNFKGIHLRLMPWANSALNNFASLDWGYDDYSVNQFFADMDLPVPQQLKLSANNNSVIAQNRYTWIQQHVMEQWIEWRCRKIADLYTRIVERIHKSRPDLKVYSHVFWPMEEQGGVRKLREAGIDPALLSRIPGVELVNSQYAYGRREPNDMFNLSQRSSFLDHAVMTSLIRQGAAPLFMTGAAYFEVTNMVVRPELIDFPANIKNGWISSAAAAPGRLGLERYATLLAETDALMLGDGGNMFTFGLAEVSEFMKVYTSLPDKPFERKSIPGADIALWEYQSSSEHYFYLVNKTSQEMRINLEFSSSTKLQKIFSDEIMDTQEKNYIFVMRPFDLVGFRLPTAIKVLNAYKLP